MPATPSRASAVTPYRMLLPPAAVRCTTVSTGMTRSCRLLPPCAKPTGRRPVSKTAVRLREDHARARALVPEVRERDPDLARVVGRHRREDVPALRVDPAAMSLGGCGVIVQQEEPVVGGEDEPAHARVAQHAPGRAELLQGKVEHGGADTLLAGLVDLLAVHDDQPRLGDRPLQRGHCRG